MKVFAAIIKRDLRLALRQRLAIVLVVLFFVLSASLFPLGIGPQPEIIIRVAPGVIWVTALLAVLLSLEGMFLTDYEDGSLDLIVFAPESLVLIVLAKVIAHWLVTGLPLLAAVPLIALYYNMEVSNIPVMIVALALGTPSLSLIGAIGAALTLGARRGGVLISLLVLPLYIPILIFGVSAVDAALAGLSPRPHLLLMGAILLAALPLAPWVSAAALRQALE